jgi:excinuclease ABC subunit A
MLPSTAARPEQPAAVANKPDARPPRKEKPAKKTAARKAAPRKQKDSR